jgi:hypothetical protein
MKLLEIRAGTLGSTCNRILLRSFIETSIVLTPDVEIKPTILVPPTGEMRLVRDDNR